MDGVLKPFSPHYHRIMEWFGVEGTLKSSSSSPSAVGQVAKSLDQVAQSPVQPGLEHFQEWDICNYVAKMSGENVLLCISVSHAIVISNIKRQLPSNNLANYKAKPSLGTQDAFHKPRVFHRKKN